MDYPRRNAIDVGVYSQSTGVYLGDSGCSWLSIDLETSQDIFSVTILSSSSNFEIQVGNLNEIDKNPICGQYSSSVQKLVCQNILHGRYVFLKQCSYTTIYNVRISSPTIDCVSCPKNTYSALTGTLTDCKCNIAQGF
jgi:hypothetical protein